MMWRAFVRMETAWASALPWEWATRLAAALLAPELSEWSWAVGVDLA